MPTEGRLLRRDIGRWSAFSHTHPDVSMQAGSWEVRDILATGAEAVVTVCPGCVLQIQELALRGKAPLEILNLVEVIDRLGDFNELWAKSRAKPKGQVRPSDKNRKSV